MTKSYEEAEEKSYMQIYGKSWEKYKKFYLILRDKILNATMSGFKSPLKICLFLLKKYHIEGKISTEMYRNLYIYYDFQVKRLTPY